MRHDTRAEDFFHRKIAAAADNWVGLTAAVGPDRTIRAVISSTATKVSVGSEPKLMLLVPCTGGSGRSTPPQLLAGVTRIITAHRQAEDFVEPPASIVAFFGFNVM
ncbi:MAG: hypothetical protein M3Y69_01235 [Verrucomicrobiota bacterium]|nr:hypothetical protein [Verrucomicrobiota bacterium]